MEVLSLILSFLDVNHYENGVLLFELLGLTNPEKLLVFRFWIQHSDFSEHIVSHCVCFTRNNRLHRSQGPAVLRNSGGKEWYRYGQRHRTTGPAVLGVDEMWFRDGEDGGPAVTFETSSEEWYCDGKRHRGGDKPAIVLGNGDQEWFWQGERHREGYAKQAWWYHGKKSIIVQ